MAKQPRAAPSAAGFGLARSAGTPARLRRHLELLRLSQPLRRYAGRLHPDPNASSLLVHQALSAAFAEHPSVRASTGLEESLRDDIDRELARWAARAPSANARCGLSDAAR